MRVGFALAIALLSLLSLSVQAQERVNPFAPPSSESESEVAGSAPVRARTPLRHPRLRAVLRAMEGSMANLNGHIIGIDESALGYQLVAVQEHSADFVFRGSRVRLHVANHKGISKP